MTGSEFADALARTLARFTVAELILVPLAVGSFMIKTRRLGCLVWAARTVLVGASAVVGLVLLTWYAILS